MILKEMLIKLQEKAPLDVVLKNKVDLDVLLLEIGRNEGTENYYCDKIRIQEVGFGEWYCTDTWVGWKALYLDGVLLAITYQSSRKSSVVYHWLSKSMVQKVIIHLNEIKKQDDTLDNLSYILESDLNQDMTRGYTIDYPSEILNHHRFIETETGRPCKIIKSFEGYTHNREFTEEELVEKNSMSLDMMFHGVIVKFDDIDNEEKLLYLHKDITVLWNI